MNKEVYINLLKNEVVLALGCTEPIAIAYATAKAKEVLKEKVESIELNLSANIIKNALGVGIPGTDNIGIDIAAALGAIGGDADAGLEVLKNIRKDHVKDAKLMVESNKIKTKIKDISDKLYIEVICKSKNHMTMVIIKSCHDNIVRIELDEKILFDKINEENSCNEKDMSKEITIKGIYNFAKTIDYEDIKFLLQGAIINKKVSQEGLSGNYGLSIGKTINEDNELSLSNSIETKMISGTAAASDARMAGCSLPIMATAGSGNQGITATMPSVVLVEELGKSDEELARALAISNLVTIHLKSFIGRLSPLCGAGIAAATGSSAAIAYLLGGSLENIKCSIQNMIGNVSGMICDGANGTCALKIATGIGGAIQCAKLGMNKITPKVTDGIVNEDVEITIKNLGVLGNKAMNNTDNVILDIMLAQ